MKRKWTDNIGLKVMSLLFAVVLWLIVVNTSDPIDSQVYRGIKVNVTHEEVVTNTGKTYRIVDDTDTVNVTVRAKRSILSKIKKEDITATADMKEMELSSQIPITVTVQGYTIEEAYSTPKNLQVVTEYSAKTKFPITASTIGTLRDGYVIGELKPNPETITIFGPESLVNRISKVVAKVDVTGLSQDKTLPAELTFYDSAGNVIDQSLLENNLGESGVYVDVKLMNTKTVGLQFDTDGVQAAEGYTISSVTFEPKEVQIIGVSEELKKQDVIEIPKEALNFKDLTESTETVVNIEQYLPPGIQLADENANNVVVTISVSKTGTKTVEVSVQSIERKNVPEGMKVSYTDVNEVAFTIQGPKEMLDELDLKSKVYISLANYKEGQHTVPIQVELPAGCSLVEQKTVDIILEKQ